MLLNEEKKRKGLEKSYFSKSLLFSSLFNYKIGAFPSLP